ncbi:flavin-containing monooxygenase [Nocardia sp. NPDC002869]|uniref:flavin-containing monooxygenase n=1 Tax=Nocardia sp. NPDC002869 TaxID=3161032 RepID=UPI00398CD5AC
MPDFDVVIIGAGFAGMYQLHTLRNAGFSVHAFEASDEVGGVWNLNRYPGARCDIESIEYSYSFDAELQQEWVWTQRYAPQPEILDYAKHVADRFALRTDITFDTRVTAMTWDDAAGVWTVSTDDGRRTTARFVIAASGCLSKPSRPRIDGLDDFAGELYWTSSWPRDGADLAGKRVAVIGTGSSGLQTITTIAPVVGRLTVFQRTPSYAVPAHNGPLADRLAEAKAHYPDIRERAKYSPSGFDCGDETRLMSETPDTEIPDALDASWARGGLCFDRAFADIMVDQRANDIAADYIRDRIRAKVRDPERAELLCPTYPVTTKRLCVDTGYFEVYNRSNVDLVDLRRHPIQKVTATGIVAGDTEHELDVIVMATGFDAMTGAINAIDIRNGDRTLREKWAHGPRTYLGLMTEGFPNLFLITGPQSPSVLSNMLTSIEQHVDWVSAALGHLRAHGRTRMQPQRRAEDEWVQTTNDLANLTLMPQTASWYMGANIPGKQRVFMPFIGGVGLYRQIADGVAVSGYHGFVLA